jgi:uncharacterized protein YaiI (UPF0178 family)
VTTIFVDGDACPVKDEVFKVAERYGLAVTVVGNSWLRLPPNPLFTMILAPEGPDAADDRIAEMIGRADICITNDIPLAARCLAKQALVLRPNGKAITEASIGDVLATRDLLTSLRETGAITGGPAPFSKADRSRFLSELDTMVHRAKRMV